MHPDLWELVQRLGLGEEDSAQLEALFERHRGGPGLPNTTLPDYVPVDVDMEPAPAAAEAEQLALDERYEDLGPIGEGGMGKVHRVRDRALNRVLAMKILHEPLRGRAKVLGRFLEEAQATAQLQHPNIVPIHDLGTLADGRVWFTMKEVRGQTLADVVHQVHAVSHTRWETTEEGWTFKRLIASFVRVCHAVAFANERGVVHRDLKPSNVMVDTFGETYVLDWGLAKIRGRVTDVLPGLEVADASIVSIPSAAKETQMGTVAGTPAYMPPEQARGRVDLIDGRSDVYALGAILYVLLCGRPPYVGEDSGEILQQVLEGPPTPVSERRVVDLSELPETAGGHLLELLDADLGSEEDGPPMPRELVAICERAMEREPARRYPSARHMALELEAWLDGAHRADNAQRITDHALEGVAEAEALHRDAAALHAEGEALLKDIAAWRPEEDKAPGWTRLDGAVSLRREAELRQLRVDQGLHGALRVAPDLPDAHAALAERYRRRHARAERAGDVDGMARAEALLQGHLVALPSAHETRRACAAYLEGRGALTLVTDPPGAEVLLYRYEVRNRRLVEVPERSLGRTPLVAHPLPMGRYLCVLRREGCDDVRYPVHIERLGHWDGVAPGSREPTPIWLPPENTWGADEVYIPAGWFRYGGRDEDICHPEARLWADAMVVHRFPITNAQYLTYLHDLMAQGRTEEALARAPRERTGVLGESGNLLYDFDGTRFSLTSDSEGHAWQLDWPVVHLTWFDGVAYFEWLAARTGRPWRLPSEFEWERAARGVDGRPYPWGSTLDPSWCCMMDSHVEAPLPVGIDTYPVDTSPWGVRGLGGNVYDWCLNQFKGEPPIDGSRLPRLRISTSKDRDLRVTRGGGWSAGDPNARSNTRGRRHAFGRFSVVGIRGCASLDPAG